MPEVVLEEQGLRDGLQTVRTIIPTEKKLEWIRRLVNAGLRRIQVASFVHPRLVPQMADAEALFECLDKQPGVVYSALVLNQKGVERAINAGVQHLAISLSASDTHSQRNTRMTLRKLKPTFATMCVWRARKVYVCEEAFSAPLGVAMRALSLPNAYGI